MPTFSDTAFRGQLSVYIMRDKFKMLALAITIVSLLKTAAANRESEEVDFVPFPVDSSCSCVRTHSNTKKLTSHEVVIGNRTFQVFTDKYTKREAFRFEVAFRNAALLTYGIAIVDDFNSDGLADYSWYATDDSADEMYIMLSSKADYRKLDVYKTIKAEWKRRFPRSLLHFTSDSDALVSLVLINRAGKLALKATIEPFQSRSRHTLNIPETDFVYTRSNRVLQLR